jgi:hypothetical protein
VRDFAALVKEKAKNLELNDEMLKRAVNEGFSGGEKKRNEVFQMAVLEPKLCILDETDSGLDIDALQIVADGVACGEFSSDLVVRVSVFGILGALNWVPEWYSPDGPSSADAIGNQLADSLIGGLKAPRSRSKTSAAAKA